jgi:ATP-dependent RNA helicase DDX56/DBP9
MNNEKFIYVDEDKEDPSVVDPSKLKTISSRKLWKIKHGFKIKKTNKRLERKGIFQA